MEDQNNKASDAPDNAEKIKNTDKSQLKKKIAESLDNLNQSSRVFDDMINDYNILYQKYISIQIMAEQNQRLTSIQLSKAQENASKMDQAELEKAYAMATIPAATLNLSSG